MKGLPSTTVALPVKMASRSYGLSFQMDTGRCAQWIMSRETTCPMSGPWPGASHTWSWYMRWYMPCTSS